MKIVYLNPEPIKADVKKDTCVVKTMFLRRRPMLSVIKSLIVQHAGIIA